MFEKGIQYCAKPLFYAILDAKAIFYRYCKIIVHNILIIEILHNKSKNSCLLFGIRTTVSNIPCFFWQLSIISNEFPMYFELQNKYKPSFRYFILSVAYDIVWSLTTKDSSNLQNL